MSPGPAGSGMPLDPGRRTARERRRVLPDETSRQLDEARCTMRDEFASKRDVSSL